MISSYEVSDTSQNLLHNANSLARGAISQSETIEVLSQNMSNISNQVSQTSDNATLASQFANEVGVEMQTSNEKMQQVVQSMNTIAKTSTEIEQILKTIDDIAFQTNILALNASIEANRGGSY